MRRAAGGTGACSASSASASSSRDLTRAGPCHLAIGPAGVLCIRTIDVGQQSVSVARGALRVAGTTSSHVRESEFEVGRAERALGVAQGSHVKAIGVIVVVDPHSITVRDMPRDVVVVDPAGLVGALEALPACLDEHEIRRLVAHAEKPSTWNGCGACGSSRSAVRCSVWCFSLRGG